MRFIFWILLSCVYCALAAQPQQQKIFDNGFDTPGIAFALPLADKGMLLGSNGYTGKYFTGFVCRVDSFGMVQWYRQHADPDPLHQVIVTSADVDGSGFFLAGVTDTTSSTLSIDLLKCDSAGNTLWHQAWAVPTSSFITSPVVKSIPGGCVLGYSFFDTTNTTYTALLWFDATGNRLQTNYYTGAYYFRALETDNAGNVYMASFGNYGSSLSKVNAAGTALWTKEFPTTSPVQLHLCPDGNLVALLRYGITGTGITVEKMDTAANIIWSKTVNVVYTGIAADLTVSNDNECYVVVNALNNPPGVPRAKLLKFSSSGTPLWAMGVDTATAVLFGCVSSSANRVVVLGRHAATPYHHDVYMAVMDSAGQTNCSQLTDTFLPTSLYVGRVAAFIQPATVNETPYSPAWLNTPAPITQTILCYTSVQEHPEDEIAVTIYPNPGDGHFTLSGTLPENSNLEVCNMLGQIVHREDLSRGDIQLPVDLSTLAPGMYVWRIIENGRERKRERIIIAR